MRALLAILAIGAFFVGCAEPSSREGRGVIARLGRDLARSVEMVPAARAIPSKIGGSWRNQLGAAVFEVAVPDTAEAIAWSCGSLARDGTQGAFSIELRSGDGPWRLFDGRSLDSSPRWHDFERWLPRGTSRSMRFRATAEGDGTPPIWGSIRFLGPLTARQRPNVVLISLDTLGAGHLGAFGGPPDVSPNIDDFLRSGVSFEKAYAQYGNTLVSHSSLFSALHPVRHGVRAGSARRRLQSSLVRALADAGYQTLAFTDGGNVSPAFGFGVGFDRYEDGEGPIGRRTGGEPFDHALRWLSERARDEQVFLFVHTYEVHTPYLPRDEAAFAFADRLTPGDHRRLSRPEQSQLVREHKREYTLPPRDLARLEALHRAEIHSLDSRLPDFLAEVTTRLHDPIVILLSDHGDQFGEWGRLNHGSSLHDRVIHVPLAFRGPGIEPRRVSTPVELVDVMPTLFELLELPVPAQLDGRSLVPGFRADAALEPRPAFAEQRADLWECGPRSRKCSVDRLAVVEGRFKLIDSRSPEAERRLYDLYADPLETTDVASRHPEVVARLAGDAREYRSRTPRSTGDEGSEAPPLDAATLEQLRALGYEPEATGATR